MERLIHFTYEETLKQGDQIWEESFILQKKRVKEGEEKGWFVYVALCVIVSL